MAKYLLWEESLEDCNNESFVMFKTDADDETAKKFISFYFNNFEVLAVVSEYSELNKAVEVVLFTKKEIDNHYEQIRLKKESEKSYNHALYEFLKPYPGYFDFEDKLKETEREMNKTIFREFVPGTLTDEMIEQLKSDGFEKHKSRYRRVDHAKIRKEFEEKMRFIRQQREEVGKIRSQKQDEYEAAHPRPVFDILETYQDVIRKNRGY